MNKVVLGILAHVDAGKTTLAESILFNSGKIRKVGRVDSGDTALDTHTLEKERGITIFAGKSYFQTENFDIDLLDTPGHIDFSAETERTLKVLDYAILVISGTDGVQAHTRTLWRLLESYGIPTFIFVTKMDYARYTKEDILSELQNHFGSGCVDFSQNGTPSFYENIAMCDERLIEKYLESDSVAVDDIKRVIKIRKCFPCYFGSGLKGEGVSTFIDALDKYILPTDYINSFGARVFKITHDSKGERITHIKLTGGSLKVRDTVNYGSLSEKITSIRRYSGEKFVAVDEGDAGGIYAVTGLSKVESGMGLGIESDFTDAFLEPVMNYRIVLPDECNPDLFLPKLKLLEAEDPLLRITWDSHLREIYVSLMGDVQTEILKSIIRDRFDVDVDICQGRVLYKETVTSRVEGVGHYEPLRHYAEVHLIIEPLERGSGIVITSHCKEDALSSNWQNLILLHLREKEHLGVLTGSPVTDVKITLAAGRAHLKHTEGGDFRQATYRAVRQGLMQAESVLLEPYYQFRLEIPTTQLGRAITDIKLRHGDFDAPVDLGEMSVITGKAPVVTMSDYAVEVASYTSGRGKLFCEVCGYDVCHNAAEVIAEKNYVPESDLDNTPDSVFCAHGGGFNVKWDKVFEYMHIESVLSQEKTPYEPVYNTRNFSIDDKELEAIMNRTFGVDKHPFYRYAHTKTPAKANDTEYSPTVHKKLVIVDGYNVIFAWNDLKSVAKDNLSIARDRLIERLCNYAAFTKCEIVVVFDAYKVSGNQEKTYTYNNIRIVYTKERQLGDNYIETFISEIGKNYNVRVVSSDNLIGLSVIRFGAVRVSALEFEDEIIRSEKGIDEFLQKLNKSRPTKIGDLIDILQSQ